MQRTSSRLAARMAVTMLCVGALTLPMHTAAAASSDTSPLPSSAITVADLADSSADQQRWLSEPDSRIALNPSHRQTDDARPKPDNSLDTMYYADQRKRTADAVVRNSFTRGDRPEAAPAPADEGDLEPALSERFSDGGAEQRWRSTNNGGTLRVDATGGTVSPGAGTSWGAVGRDITVDVEADPVLLVTVASATGTWALKVAPRGGTDILVQNDTSQVGTFAYDLKALGVASGPVTVKLFASGNGTASFRDVSIHARPGLVDDFTDLTPWRTDVQSNNGATITAAEPGRGATVTSSSDGGFGAVARTVTVNLTSDPILSVAVGPLSAGSQWAIKLTGADGRGDFAVVQNDTAQTGMFSYDLAALTGLSGEQTFGVKLFSTKTPTPTSATFTRLSFHASNNWLQVPTASTNTWNPQSLDWTGTYAEAGTYATRDVFVDADTVSRLVVPEEITVGSPTLSGLFAAPARWDAAARALTVARDGYTRTVAFPADAEVLFFDSANAAALGAGGSSTPLATSTAWLSVMPATNDSALGIGYAYGTDATASTASVTSAVSGTDPARVRTALALRTTQWNDYLAAVPVVEDFELRTVDAAGSTGADIRAMYYRAFVNLKQTVVPPQPESGISHVQVATGKAATYNGGSARNRASASWDSLLGIQYLGYTEPELAWDALIGMMADVEPDGGLNGEALPSRKAQTAWMLYTITGDKAKLAQVYPAIKAHMGWSSEHLAWNIDSHFPGGGVPAADERDAEFVNSLAIDLDYAAESARVLGFGADADSFAALQATLITQYQEWFFMPDGRAVQYYWTSKPDASYEQRKGTVNYVPTGLHMPGLTDAQIAAIMTRFDAEYEPAGQFAGVAEDALKAPDAQFVAYGLIEQGQAEKARVYLEAVLRDVTRTNKFSEVYQAGEGGAAPISRGESPTTFGMAQVIDNLWILNGYRSDAGTPTFVRLPGTTGGIAGLTYLGRPLDVDVDGSRIRLGGDAAAQTGVCEVFDAPEGSSIRLPTTCGSLTLSTNTVAAGERVTVSAAKLPPGASTTVELRSEPITLASAIASADGTIALTVTIPADTKPGRHTVVVSSGEVTAQAELAVRAASSSGGNQTPTPGTTPETPGTPNAGEGGSHSLAATGGELMSMAIPGLAALALLTVGIGATLMARRHASASSDRTA